MRPPGPPDVADDRDYLLVEVYGIPAQQGSKKAYVNRYTGRAALVDDSAKTKPWRSQVTAAARDSLRYDNGVTLPTGPVEVEVTFHFPHPKKHYRTGRFSHVLRDDVPHFHSIKPDVDKLLRAILDGLTDAGVFRDDAQVAAVKATKVYTAGTPKAEIWITEAGR